MFNLDKTSEKEQSIVAYFDFDGTITSWDTLLLFLRYAVGNATFCFKLFLAIPIGILYGLKIITNEAAKQKMLQLMIKGYSQVVLENKAHDFALRHLDRLIKPEIYAKLEYHLEHKHQIILVSANLALYLRHWAKRHNILAVIATEIEFIDEICTGKLATRNCYGKQKVIRINNYLTQNNLQFKYSYGYGNSKGDYELLNYVNEGYYINGIDIIPWLDYYGKPKL